MKPKRWGVLLGLTVGLMALMSPARRSVAAETYEQIRLLVDVLQKVRAHYVEEVDSKTLVYGAAQGLVRVLDPFSQFLDPDGYKELRAETSGQFGGLGIRIGVRDGWLMVITPIPNTPAFRAGIWPGDKIVKIEGVSTQGISVNDAVSKLRGKPKTKVTITIFREGEKDTREVTLIREDIKIESTRSKMLDANIGYVKIIEFNEDSALDLDRRLQDLKTKGMASLVLDLRNDPGGLLTTAVDTVALFVAGRKLVVYTEGRTSPRQEFRSEEKCPWADLPMVVLVNQGSASGSEIVAGALQDHKRALIMGSETFGKGSVQSILALDDGSALRLTTAKYYLPLGRCIHRDEKTGKGGITPDIVIQVPRDVEAKILAQAEEVTGKDRSTESAVKVEDQVKDEILNRAMELLKAQAVFHGLQPT